MSSSGTTQPRAGTEARPGGRGASSATSVRAEAYDSPPEVRTTTAPAAASAPPAGDAASRRVRLSASRVNPWSVAKLAFLLSVALGIVGVVAVALLWSVLNGMDAFGRLNTVVRQVIGTESTFNLTTFLSLSRVLSVTIIIAVIDVVLLTVLSTIGAVLYNLASALVGGLRLTLSDD